MSAAAAVDQRLFFDRWGRRLACEVCGDRLKQPSHGRPRVRCADPRCEVRARTARRTRERSAREQWRKDEFPAALKAWEHRCAFCARRTEDLTPSRYHLAPLPACDRCQDARAQLRVAPKVMDRIIRYLESSHPGCPLPDAGGL